MLPNIALDSVITKFVNACVHFKCKFTLHVLSVRLLCVHYPCIINGGGGALSVTFLRYHVKSSHCKFCTNVICCIYINIKNI